MREDIDRSIAINPEDIPDNVRLNETIVDAEIWLEQGSKWNSCDLIMSIEFPVKDASQPW